MLFFINTVSEGKLVCCCPTTTPADKRVLEPNLCSPSATGQPNGTTPVSLDHNIICAQVQDDVLVKVLKTVQQLTAKLNGDADPPEVIQNCRAIQACLDTIAAIKRSKATEPYGLNPIGLEQQISPTNATVTKRDPRAQYNGSSESHQ
ncbi:hypothetical protein AHF37_00979 [Paragonimus kellicotti]|nr:hypothetical protein AHF37_00979 [Paragonimus kellicotti]